MTTRPMKLELKYDQAMGYYRIIAEDGMAIAEIIAGQPEARQLAKLLTAAPLMLTALENIREWLMDTGPVVDNGITHPLFVKANNATNAAIAAATGGA